MCNAWFLDIRISICYFLTSLQITSTVTVNLTKYVLTHEPCESLRLIMGVTKMLFSIMQSTLNKVSNCRYNI